MPLAEAWPWLAGLAALVLGFWLGRSGRRDGRLEAALEQRLQAQERALGETLARSLDRVSARAAEGERRGAADAAALRTQLSGLTRQQEGVGQALGALQRVLDSKQARGAFGEVQLERLVSDLLPASAFRMQAALGPYRADCLIRLPFPPGPVAVDAKFPLEGYQAWQAAQGDAKAAAVAQRRFRRDVAAHVEAIASKYIRAGETADFALMFVPSEAVFAAVHSECRPVVEAAERARVFLVSPGTLWPLLNTLAAVLRDVRFAANTAAMQAQATQLAADAATLADLAAKAQRDWSRLGQDVQALMRRADALALAGKAFAEGGAVADTGAATELRATD
ncbi:MAG: DNA recombination protein RmuC [Alphaproteobacteria bacterium]|nr:DNA recombination protein RmuC [Alphaproteobacteria bacterium]MCB9929295.1 DNA recombination protein RmuC [Alphaproteobacteria bacterium]